MSRKAIIIIFAAIIVLIIAASSGSIYYFNQQLNKARKEIASLKREKKNLKKELKVSKEENKKLKAENKKLKEQLAGKNGFLLNPEEESSEADLIRQAVIARLEVDGLNPDHFNVEQIKYKSNWATAVAVSSDRSIEDAIFVLQKNGKWKVLTYGTGIDQSDYPTSPPEIW